MSSSNLEANGSEKQSILSFFKTISKNSSKPKKLNNINKLKNSSTDICLNLTDASSDIEDKDGKRGNEENIILHISDEPQDTENKEKKIPEVIDDEPHLQETKNEQLTNIIDIDAKDRNNEESEISDTTTMTNDNFKSASNEQPSNSLNDENYLEKESNSMNDVENTEKNQDKADKPQNYNKDKEDERLKLKAEKEEQKIRMKKLKEEERLRIKKEKEEERLRIKKQKEEERLRIKKEKEEERLRIKEEEKRKREELKRAREEEKYKKEQERLQKEEERKKREESKERNQSRIGNFFRKVNDSSRQISQQSDYERYFLPFYTRDTVIIAKNFNKNSKDLTKTRNDIDTQISRNSATPDDLLHWINSKRTERGYPIKYKAVTLLQQMTSKDKTDKELQEKLALIPQKYIKFYENVRPPFIGTYSKDFVIPIDKPYTTEGTDYNYDFDSDLEWVNNEDEDDDGAGIDNLESGEEDDDGEDEDEASEGEFDGFLDADNPNGTTGSKKKFIGPLIPTVLLRANIKNITDVEDRQYFESVQIIPFSDRFQSPIDPLAKSSIQQADDNNSNYSNSDSKNAATNQLGLKRGNESDNSPAKAIDNKKQKTIIVDSKDLLKLFDEVHGSMFSLATVTEIAQKGLPHYNKQTIKNTVKQYFTRSSGKGDTSRKWEINDTQLWESLKSQS